MSLASAMAPVLATLPTNSNGTCRLHIRPVKSHGSRTPSPSLRAPTMTFPSQSFIRVYAGNGVMFLLTASTLGKETNAGHGYGSSSTGYLSLQPSLSPWSITLLLTPDIATAAWSVVTSQRRVLNQVACKVTFTISSGSISDNH